ncbi:MAG TPA: hypothetical protein EYF95_05060 [Flavobacteriales bacterium]|nr:hypothetical protein [Flavobacteriales bacterium]
MKPFKTYIAELFDKPLPYRKLGKLKPAQRGVHQSIDYEFSIEIDEVTTKVTTTFRDVDGTEQFSVEFDVGDKFNITGLAGAAAIKIFTTVTAQIVDFIKSEQPIKIEFTAAKARGEGSSRSKLYDRMTKRLTPKGYILDAHPWRDGSRQYTFTKVE